MELLDRLQDILFAQNEMCANLSSLVRRQDSIETRMSGVEKGVLALLNRQGQQNQEDVTPGRHTPLSAEEPAPSGDASNRPGWLQRRFRQAVEGPGGVVPTGASSSSRPSLPAAVIPPLYQGDGDRERGTAASEGGPRRPPGPARQQAQRPARHHASSNPGNQEVEEPRDTGRMQDLARLFAHHAARRAGDGEDAAQHARADSPDDDSYSVDSEQERADRERAAIHAQFAHLRTPCVRDLTQLVQAAHEYDSFGDMDEPGDINVADSDRRMVEMERLLPSGASRTPMVSPRVPAGPAPATSRSRQASEPQNYGVVTAPVRAPLGQASESAQATPHSDAASSSDARGQTPAQTAQQAAREEASRQQRTRRARRSVHRDEASAIPGAVTATLPSVSTSVEPHLDEDMLRQLEDESRH